MLKAMLAVATLLFVAAAPRGADAQCVSLTAVGVAYTQNFDSLANTGTTASTLPTGWNFIETGTSANTTYGVDDGGGATGNTFSYGSTGSTDRAFGTLLSGSVTSTIGACFTNNTGTTLTGLSIGYTGEEWRLGTAARADALNFEYSLNATSLTSGTWTAVSGLNFVTQDTATTGAKNGNAAGEHQARSSSISALAIANGATFWIHWLDGNASGADDGLAVDDFSLTPQGTTATPTLTLSAPTIPEGNSGTSTAIFTVSLDNPAPVGGVTFQIDTVDGTASAGSDYVAIIAGSGSIGVGQTSTTFTVTIDGDTVYEGNETFSANLSNITNTTNATASTGATITDDDAQPTITVSNASTVEGDSGTSQVNFPVTLSNASAFGVSFSVQTADASATAGSDYDALNTIVTIPAGSTSGIIAVTVHGDTTTEPDETFTLQLSGASGGTLAATVATGTIQNDDGVTPMFSIGNVTQAEGNSGTSSFVFTVSSNVNAPAGGFTLNVDTADASAVAGEDYVALHGTAVIAAGTNSTTVAVQVNGDNKYESAETFGVTLSNPPAGTAIGTATGTGTISNDDALPTLSIANVAVNEGNSGTSTATFNVTLSNPSASAITFTINTADNTATAGSDYVAIVNGSGSIPAGGTSTTVAVTINGDTGVEANETFSVNLSAIANASNATASATGTINNDDYTTIMQIQGHGTASPLNNATVTTRGVVTAKKSNGFFMQDALGDGDPTTSDAIFVFTGAAGIGAVQVNDDVTVTGKVVEFSGSTELSNTPVVSVNARPAAVLPQAWVLDANPPTNNPTTGICMGGNSTIPNPPAAADGYQASNFACLDGMLLTINDATVNGATFGNAASDGVHTGTPTGTYIKVSDGTRAFHGPGAMWPGIAGQPGIPVWNGEPEVFELYYPGLGFSATGHLYNAGARISVTGVLQGFAATGATSPIYELYPYSITDVAPAPAYPQAVAASAAGTLTIGSQNMLHFFNNTADGADTAGYNDTCAGTGTTDTCPTLAEYQARVSKWTRQICDVLHAPVVMDIEEIENILVARDLASSISGYCGVTYQPYLIPGNDVSGINIGILVRNEVTVSSVTQMYKGTQTANCSSGSGPCLLNDRPPVLMRASWNGYSFALLAMYDRSLSGITVTDPAKLYVGAKRAEQAAQIASIAQAFQSGATLAGAGNAQQDATGTVTNGTFDIVGDASVPLIIAGDFNAYEFSDGIADVSGMITGHAVQSQNFFWYTGNAFDPTPAYVAPSPTLVDTGIKAAPGERYSFNFSGLAQEIDHIVVSRRAWKAFVGIGNAHGNSDVSEADPIILNGTTAARSGDHDGQVITLAIDRIFADGYDPQP